MRRSCLATAASVGLAWAGRGEAKPVAGVELHWVAPARCPGAEDVRARVRRLLGSDAAGASSGERLVAEGTVVEASGHYRLSLKVRQPDAQPAEVTRVVESMSCDGLAGAAAVILALFARGEADGAASPAAPSGTDTPSSVPSSGSAPASSGGSSIPPRARGDRRRARRLVRHPALKRPRPRRPKRHRPRTPSRSRGSRRPPKRHSGRMKYASMSEPKESAGAPLCKLPFWSATSASFRPARTVSARVSGSA